MSYAPDHIVNDPVTRETLTAGLKKLGLRDGMIVEVHARLSSFDCVIGGARTVVDALMDIAGENGTIVMPVNCHDNAEPSTWKHPVIQPQAYASVRSAIPPYDPQLSDIPDMGEVAENFRRRKGVIFSQHPRVSYAAWGRYAKLLCNRQSLHFPLAEESPAARMYEMKGFVLLMGCDFDSATSMHLAEYRTDDRPIRIEGCCMQTDQGPQWKNYLDLDLDSSDFTRVRSELVKKKAVRETVIGGSRIQFFPLAYAVDEATRYFESNSVFELYR
ncbi:MAG: AAC(3) family N-acetyltransferase [Lactimicrobium sp.]|jgi:aminoglycoside 3-N-acetyltransferase|uniref:aminoglycoside N(3)-acetyltransferase n=1 Tax=Lactimicrobium sp. TaxID=2563780 RepID=UPI002F350498